MGAVPAERVCYYCRLPRAHVEFKSSRRYAACASCREQDLKGRTRGGLGLSQRPSTENARTMKAHLRMVERYPEDVQRPRTRGDCVNGPRPCPWVSCRHHLFLDVSANGHLRHNFPDRELEDMGESCALDVADCGGSTLEDVSRVINVVRERVRQIEETALEHLRSEASVYSDEPVRVMSLGSIVRLDTRKRRRDAKDEDDEPQAPVVEEEPTEWWGRIVEMAYRAMLRKGRDDGRDPRLGKWNEAVPDHRVADGNDG